MPDWSVHMCLGHHTFGEISFFFHFMLFGVKIPSHLLYITTVFVLSLFGHLRKVTFLHTSFAFIVVSTFDFSSRSEVGIQLIFKIAT